jgi:hypothetical protein
MPLAWTSPAKGTRKTAKGDGKGGGSQQGAGSGGAAAKLLQATNAALKKRASKLETEKLEVKKVAARAAAEGKKYWTCAHCGGGRCFATRMDCHKCQKPRVLTPPGLEQAEAFRKGDDQVMAGPAEVPLEDRIAQFELDIKVMKAVKTPELVAIGLHSEAELLKLKEQQQRQERPLPARMHAATHREEKYAMTEQEANKELAEV